jgi:hypothetical protein
MTPVFKDENVKDQNVVRKITASIIFGEIRGTNLHVRARKAGSASVVESGKPKISFMNGTTWSMKEKAIVQ